MRMTKSEFERLAKSLEGKRIARVNYWQNPYPEDPRWDQDPRFDTVEQGIDLEMENGEIYALMWDNTFFCYGVGVWEHSMESRLIDCKNWDVSENSRWKPLLLKNIDRLHVYRDDQIEGIEFPQTISVTFETKDIVYLSAMEVTDRDVYYFHSRITVIFDDAVAREFLVGPCLPEKEWPT
jgi:hypothetical protein